MYCSHIATHNYISHIIRIDNHGKSCAFIGKLKKETTKKMGKKIKKEN